MGLFGTKKHSIGKTIAELRKEKGWTQIELAEKLQVSDKAISKWEKDNGAPSVEFFPALAELFGVSIDYIITGNKLEPEIIAMSKIELCAKNDDVKLFNSLTDDVITGKDENGKIILDYLLQYQSKNVVVSLFAKYPAKTILAQNGSKNSYFVFWYTEKVLELLIRNNLVNELEELDVFSTRFYGNERRAKNGNNAPDIFTAEYRKIFLTDKNISNDLKIRYFQSCTAQQLVNCLNYLIELNDKNQIEMLWNIVKPINEKNIARYEQRKKEIYSGSQICVRYTNTPGKEYEPIGTSCNYYCFVVTVPVSLIKQLLDKGYLEIARQANEFNTEIGAEILRDERLSCVNANIDGNLSENDLSRNITTIETHDEAYFEKQEQKKNADLLNAASIKHSTGNDLVNIYFQPCCEEYERTEITLFKDNQMLAKYKVDDGAFFKSISGLAYGTYEYIVKQFGKDDKLLLETDKIKFSISRPNYGGKPTIII